MPKEVQIEDILIVKLGKEGWWGKIILKVIIIINILNYMNFREVFSVEYLPS